MMERGAILGRLDALRFILNLNGNKDYVEALNEAMVLLKQEAPRLLNAADFHAENADDDSGAIPCWKETKSPTRRNGWAVITYGKWIADNGVARYWTGKPTSKRMEATPWL